MKRSCKHIDITDLNTIRPFVSDCCRRHKKRYDFRSLFIRHGMSKQDYQTAIKSQDFSMFNEVIDNIALDAISRIKNQDLQLPPVRLREMKDNTTGKIRLIGIECAMQQVLDYIAVYSAMDIFKRRMVHEQASSLPGRGQLYGTKLIQKWVKKDYDAMRYAKRHNLSYTSKCKYFVKLDIILCYPSANSDKFLELFRKDCANDDIFWLWSQLIESYKVDGHTGFMIGALPSQWAAQYMLSYLYRNAKNLHYTRRNRRYKMVNHMLLFMDDMLMIGSNKKALLIAVTSVVQYAHMFLGWNIKRNFSIKLLSDNNIDMMGYVIRRDGSISIRGRNFIHARRLALRYQSKPLLNISNAKRILAYKGYFKYSNSRFAYNKYGLNKLFYNAALLMSDHDRRTNENRKS